MDHYKCSLGGGEGLQMMRYLFDSRGNKYVFYDRFESDHDPIFSLMARIPGNDLKLEL
jgi:hypothetical protein